jgi:hypothetical protein
VTTCVYPSYRAVGRPIEFLGLQGPYILLTAIALVADFLLFVILFCCGTTTWLCLSIAFGLGATAIAAGRQLSQRFGARGLQKHLAAKRLPKAIRLDSRRVFVNLLIVVQ